MGVSGVFGRISIGIMIAVSLAFFYAASPVTTTGADNSRQLEIEKQRTETQMKELKKEIGKITKEADGVKKAIRKLDREEDQADTELTRAQRDLETSRAESAYLEKQFEIADRQFGNYRKKHQDRLVAYYKNGRAGYMEVLFNSASFSDFISRVYYLQLLTKHDLDIMDRLKMLKDDVKEKRVLVDKNAIQISQQRDLWKEKKKKLDRFQKEKQQTFNKINGEAKLLQQKLALLEKENQEIENALKRAQGLAPIQDTFSGKFASPVCGRAFVVTSPFGKRKSPKRGASRNHKGLDLRAAYKSDICAAADGIVFESSYGSGYGRYVIIRHGSGYATVYGHGQKNLVKKGDRVRRGQVIMKANSSGVSTGNHLHFEVRKDGVAINPAKFF